MAVKDNHPPPPPTPLPLTSDKIIPIRVTSITNNVPIKLSLEKHNYNSWSAFFTIHLGSLSLKSHIEDKSSKGTSSSAPDAGWCKLDDLIKMWILDDVPVVEPNQHGDVPVISEPDLVDEDEDPEKEEFEEEEKPQEEEDDMEVDIKEEENELELTYPYEEVDPLNPLPLASESEHENVNEVEDTVESKDETVPASVHEVDESSIAPFRRKESDGLLPGLMRRDINSLFGRMTSLSRRLCGHETAHAITTQ
ncbi:hypothetical protein Tco_1051021 [Tanacetum coccineum]